MVFVLAQEIFDCHLRLGVAALAVFRRRRLPT
jgi:hypothetical protein